MSIRNSTLGWMMSIPRRSSSVPFIEIREGRLAGVVTSGSSAKRLYICFVEVGTLNFNCTTNNNRRCGGLRGYPCKHIRAMVEEAVAIYGADKLMRVLKAPSEDLLACTSEHGVKSDQKANSTFARFLDELRNLRAPLVTEPIPEMAWFLAR